MSKMKNYTIYLCALTAILLTVQYFFKDQLHYTTIYIVPVFFIITLLTHLILVKSKSKDPRKFQMYFFGAGALKVLGYFAFIAVVYIAAGTLTRSFAAVFMIVYLIFTLFEMILLRPLAKK